MTDYQNELVMEHLDLVNWVIRTRISVPNRPLSDISSGSGHCRPRFAARCRVAATVFRAQRQLDAISVLLSLRLWSLRISR